MQASKNKDIFKKCSPRKPVKSHQNRGVDFNKLQSNDAMSIHSLQVKHLLCVDEVGTKMSKENVY